MNNRFKNNIKNIAEKEGWSVSFFDENKFLTTVRFYLKRANGQDYYFTVPVNDNDPDEFLSELEESYDNFVYKSYEKKAALYNSVEFLEGQKELDAKIASLLQAFKEKKSALREAALRRIPVQVTEYLQRVVEVAAINEDKAVELVEDMVNREDIILTYNDFATREVDVYRN